MPGALACRCRLPELMDDPGLAGDRHLEALTGLARIHRASGTTGLLWRPLAAHARAVGRRRLSVLDVACGGGDLAVGLWQRARRAGLELDVLGVDLSPRAVERAEALARRRGAPVRFEVGDVLAGPLPLEPDVVLSSLFLHHLSEQQAVALLAALGRATRGLMLVADLARGPAGFALAWAGTRLLTRSPVVRMDGPLSVRAAFTPAEARALAERAGLGGAVVARRWPCRWLLRWSPGRGAAGGGPR